MENENKKIESVTIEQLSEEIRNLERKLIVQEHRLIRSIINLFKSYWLRDLRYTRIATLKAFLWNLLPTRTGALVITGSLLVGVLTIFLMAKSNFLIEKQNYYLQQQNYQEAFSNIENHKLLIKEKLYDIEEHGFPRYSSKIREQALISFLEISNQKLIKPIPPVEISLKSQVKEIIKQLKNDTIENTYFAVKDQNKMVDINLSDAILTNIDFGNINNKNYQWDLRRADLTNSKLRGDFSKANFTLSNLSNIKAISFPSKIKKKPQYPRTHYKEVVNFSKAIFIGADLSSANFRNANLKGAMFDGADLRNTSFIGADISGANFFKAKNLTLEQVKKAKNWKKALYLPNE
ncbi:pentapeptide repeat-containing protein [Tenacibaculum sp. 190524A02b]|uniref:pentapeptide repeat-containing protein n=1 Tax=Tenacibaculum vairaonense TaxID=3137860 RepID=UPI0031FB5151